MSRHTLRKFLQAVVSIAIAVGGVETTHAAVPGTAYVTCAPTPAGKCRTKYPDGNDGTAAIPLTWQLIQPISITTTQCNAGFSVNLRALYLTEPGSPLATLSVAPTYSLPTGWSLTTDGLSCAGSTAGSTLVRMRATRSAVFSDTFEFRVESVLPPSVDSTAPTIPTGLTCSNSVGAAPCAWDPSSDVFEADGDAGSGVASYDICLNGTGCINVPTSDPGLSRQLTCGVVGALSPTPTCVQSGADWTLGNAAGTADGTSDLLVHNFATLTGDGFATLKVTSITSSTDFAKTMIQIRSSSSDPTAAKFECQVDKRLAGTYRNSASQRATIGGTRTTVFNVDPVTVPQWVRATAVGSLFSCDRSTDGNVWVAGTPVSIPALPATKTWGPAATATTGSGGATMTANLQQWSLNNVPRVQYTYTTLSAGSITVRANDVAGNHSSFSAPVTVTPSTPTDTTPPVRTAQPACSANGQNSINCTLGACTDPSGIRGYIPYTKTSSGGSRTTQPEQSVPSYSLTGLSASTPYFLDTKCVDSVGNVEASFSSEATATTTSPPALTAPVISSVIPTGTVSPTTTLRVTHSSVAGSHHYKVRLKLCTATNYSPVEFDHTGTVIDVTGLSPAQCYDMQVASTSNLVEANVLWSTPNPPTDQGTTLSIIGTASVKYHPGLYCDRDVWGIIKVGSSISGSPSSNCTHSAVQGTVIEVAWAVIEPTLNNYTFTVLDSVVQKVKNSGKRYAIQLWVAHCCSKPSSFPTQSLPAYLNDRSGANVYGGYLNNSYGAWSMFWRPAVMDRINALTQAICAHYDSDVKFEWLGMQETAVFNSKDPSGVDEPNAAPGNYITQLQRWAPIARTACPHSGLQIWGDWGPISDLNRLLTTANQYKIGIGSTDLAVGRETTMDRIVRGAGVIGTNDYGTVDWRSKIPIMHSLQYGPYQGATCESTLISFSRSTAKSNFLFIVPGLSPAGTCTTFLGYRNAVVAQGGVGPTACPVGMNCDGSN